MHLIADNCVIFESYIYIEIKLHKRRLKTMKVWFLKVLSKAMTVIIDFLYIFNDSLSVKIFLHLSTKYSFTLEILTGTSTKKKQSNN